MSAATMLLIAAGGLVWPGVALLIFRGRSAEARHIAWGLFAAGDWLSFLGDVLRHSPTSAAIDGVMAAIYTWVWWRGRRKGRGKKALKELGAKSRARIEALARQMTPSPIPSPVGAGS